MRKLLVFLGVLVITALMYDGAGADHVLYKSRDETIKERQDDVFAQIEISMLMLRYQKEAVVRRILENPGIVVGIGIEVSDEGGELYVGQVVAGSPAERVGVRVGDRILSINGKAVNTPAELFAEIKGSGNPNRSISLQITQDKKTVSVTMLSAILREDKTSGAKKLVALLEQVYADLVMQIEKIRTLARNAIILDLENFDDPEVKKARNLSKDIEAIEKKAEDLLNY